MSKVKVRIELDSDGIQALLKSGELAEVCEGQAERMTRATGMEYKSDVKIGRYRVRAGGYSKAAANAEAAKERKYPMCPKCGREHARCRCKGR